MTALIQPVARADRSVLVKLLANSESVREVKASRAGRRCEVRVLQGPPSLPSCADVCWRGAGAKSLCVPRPSVPSSIR